MRRRHRPRRRRHDILTVTLAVSQCFARREAFSRPTFEMPQNRRCSSGRSNDGFLASPRPGHAHCRPMSLYITSGSCCHARQGAYRRRSHAMRRLQAVLHARAADMAKYFHFFSAFIVHAAEIRRRQPLRGDVSGDSRRRAACAYMTTPVLSAVPRQRRGAIGRRLLRHATGHDAMSPALRYMAFRRCEDAHDYAHAISGAVELYFLICGESSLSSFLGDAIFLFGLAALYEKTDVRQIYLICRAFTCRCGEYSRHALLSLARASKPAENSPENTSMHGAAPHFYRSSRALMMPT